MQRNTFLHAVLGLALATLSWAAPAQTQHDGSAAKPLRVILIPADGGTEDGTKKMTSRPSSAPSANPPACSSI